MMDEVVRPRTCHHEKYERLIAAQGTRLQGEARSWGGTSPSAERARRQAFT